MTKLTDKQKRMRRRIVVSAVLLAALKTLPLPPAALGIGLLAPYLLAGYDVLGRAVRNIRAGQVFDENFLMAVATLGAYGTGEYAEAVFVMLFYQTGELFQDYAVGRSRQSIAALMDIRPDTAAVETSEGVRTVDPESVAVGDVIVVAPGERVPLDGVVLEGESTLDTAALTGESLPRSVHAGEGIVSGFVNLTGVLRITVTKPCEASTVSRILELVESSGEKKARSEQFITRFARYYTPAVVYAALALFLIPTALLAWAPTAAPFLALTTWQDWLHRALTFLVISCPCALVISVPLSFFGGIGGASRCGILVKGGGDLETLAAVDTIVFDKTGTLTQGTFSVAEISPAGDMEAERLLAFAALAEQYSSHPIALSLQKAFKGPIDPRRADRVEETAGEGVTAVVDGHAVGVGNRRLMERLAVACPAEAAPGTVVYVAVDGAYAGRIVISDRPKADAKGAIAALKALGVSRTVMLTGDAPAAAAQTAEELGVDEYHARLLPADKVERLEALLQEAAGKVAFVGDGINDAPVLTRADVGIAMGGLGSDAAIEAADVVLMDDAPGKIPLAVGIARKTVGIVRQNIVLALGIKAVVLVLGAVGKAPMYLAVFADVGVAFLAILNACRCLRPPKGRG